MDKFQKPTAYKSINTSAPQKKESQPPLEKLSFFKRWFY